MLQLISQVGGLTAVAPDTLIYDAGFSSTRALELLLALEEEFSVSIPDKDFIAARTPRDLVSLLERLHERQVA